jgi:hypothetical protein
MFLFHPTLVMGARCCTFVLSIPHNVLALGLFIVLLLKNYCLCEVELLFNISR